jgi:hypothetical protein
MIFGKYYFTRGQRLTVGTDLLIADRGKMPSATAAYKPQFRRRLSRGSIRAARVPGDRFLITHATTATPTLMSNTLTT